MSDEGPRGPVTQEWTHSLSMMQQSVLLSAIRGADGSDKYHPSKWILRWFRRCILLSAMDGLVLADPVEVNGGSFTGPSVSEFDIDDVGSWQAAMDARADEYISMLDGVPHHFHLHLMHAAEIVGYKHPDAEIRGWWHSFYLRLVADMHLGPESEETLDHRLGDVREQWLEHADPATLT